MKLKYLDLAFKREDVTDAGVFSGYASTYNVDKSREIIAPGAFDRTLKDRSEPVRLLWQHNSREPIGVFDELVADDKGLRFKARLALGVQRGRETYELMKMGAVDRMSIGFSIPSMKDVEETMTGTIIFKAVNLHEISVVTFPANGEAVVTSVKGFGELPLSMCAEAIETERDFERFLRDAGFSAKMSKTLTSTWKNTARDAGDVVLDEETLTAAKSLRDLFKTR